MANYLDFRYNSQFHPGSVQLPQRFGPPDMSQQFQSGISGLADPIVQGLKELQGRYEAMPSRTGF